MSLPPRVHKGDLVRVVKLRDPENWDPQSDYAQAVGKILKILTVWEFDDDPSDATYQVDGELELFSDEIEVVFTT